MGCPPIGNRITTPLDFNSGESLITQGVRRDEDREITRTLPSYCDLNAAHA